MSDLQEEWFTLDSIEPVESDCKLYCISVDSPEKQFLIGNLGIPTHNTDKGKEDDALKSEAQMIIGSIARLGRAAGVHLIIATQRPDAKLINGETKANLGVRVNCGTTNSITSSMVLENAEGTRVKSNPRGRIYLQIYGKGDHGQGFFADQGWIDDYLASQGKNPDGSPLNSKRSKLVKNLDMSGFEGTDLDSETGVDNSTIIEKIRQEEEQDDSDVNMEDILEDSDNVNEEEEFYVEEEVDQASDKLGRPVLGGKKEEGNPWDRPEDDWDMFLDEVIEENYS